MTVSVKAKGQSEGGQQQVLTLHVYENLIQIPVVVLSNRHELLPPIAARRFRVSVDSGPPFHPPHVRAEGNDPIALSILIDVSRSQEELLKQIGSTIAAFGTVSLQSRDRISIYVEDECAVSRVIFDSPPDFREIGPAVDMAVRNSLMAIHAKTGSSCRPEPHLWDALGYVVHQTAALPGRRAVLAITDGEDEHSRLTWLQVKTLATRNGVAVFGMRASELASFDFTGPPPNGPEDKLPNLCELTGGLVFTATQHSLSRRLVEFAALLRDRYIVEFPRPDHIGIGDYGFVVTVAGLDAFVRPAGISVPIPDPKVADDPNTLGHDPSLAPKVGKRKVVPKTPQ